MLKNIKFDHPETYQVVPFICYPASYISKEQFICFTTVVRNWSKSDKITYIWCEFQSTNEVRNAHANLVRHDPIKKEFKI